MSKVKNIYPPYKIKSATNFDIMKGLGVLDEGSIELTIEKVIREKIKINDLFEDDSFKWLWYSIDRFFENNPDCVKNEGKEVTWGKFLNARYVSGH